jgi:tetratricopeptide (TPR) repeat protein
MWGLLVVVFAFAVAGFPAQTSQGLTIGARELTQAAELTRQGQDLSAERILLEFVQRCDRAKLENVDLALALQNLGVIYGEMRRLPEAERKLLRALQVARRQPGPAGEAIERRAKLHLANIYLDMGRTGDAVKLDLPGLIVPAESPEFQARVRGTIASVATARRDYSTAEQAFEELLAFWRDPVRASHSLAETATIQNNLGVLALWQGNLGKAHQLLEQSADDWSRATGPNSPLLARTMSNFGVACLRMKRPDEAIFWLERSMKIVDAAFGPKSAFTVQLQTVYAEALKKSGRKQEGREMERAALETRKGWHGATPGDYTIDQREMMGMRGR